MYGELVPIGGGDPIPLLKSYLTLGRRESCDIVLRFGNVSGQHCEMTLDRGWWFIKDLNSQNGTRVNGLRVAKKRLDPGDRLTIARHDYEVRYSPSANGGDDTHPPEDDVFSDIMGRSLLESAGLDRRTKQSQEGKIGLRRKLATDAVEEFTEELDLEAHVETPDSGEPASSGEQPTEEQPLEESDEPTP